MSRDRSLTTDPLRRFLKIGSLAGRVSASVVGDRIRGAVRDEKTQAEGQRDNLVRNALRIVETLGELRGGAMKVGQMLSLHESLFPPEVAAVLGQLQQRAPAVPFEVIEYEIRDALPNFDDLFESLEPEAFAAASIGQVHHGVLRDGREVAVKIQYPLIDRIIGADLANLRTLLQRLFALFTEMEFEPFWQELEARLHEELDYEIEARNLREMAELYAGVDQVMIPTVVDEASGRHILTMQYLPGIRPADAASSHYDAELRDRWGQALMRFVLRGLFVHRIVHADPNFANFAFRDDGRLIVYDFGCMKRLSNRISSGYHATVSALLAGEVDQVPEHLAAMGVQQRGRGLPPEILEPYIQLFDDIFRATPTYRFGEDETVYERIFELGLTHLSSARELSFPEDMIFVDRALAGHFGNLVKLDAAGPWREILRDALDEGAVH